MKKRWIRWIVSWSAKLWGELHWLLVSWDQLKNKQPFFMALWSRIIIIIIIITRVLSQRRDLLEQPPDFYEPDVLPATQPIVSKHYRKTQWFGRLLFDRHGISTPCRTNSVKALNNRLLAGRMITLWVRRLLSVSQQGQLSLSSSRGRLMSSKLHQLVL